MLQIEAFTFNPFGENTYLLWDETLECIIIDPGCSNSEEEFELVSFIEEKGLKPVRLINTHTHIDHILGNKFIADKYNLGLEFCESDLPTFRLARVSATRWNVNYTDSPEPVSFLQEGDVITFGNIRLECVFTPGHSPGSLCFIHHETKNIIAGDVLFYGSIGRTDLPGGNHPQLIESIKSRLLVLPDDYQVHPGHGPSTTIGFERRNNPFIQ